MAQTGPKNVDWDKARRDYISDNTMTYVKIAKKYGVVKKSVEQIASKQKWVETRRELGEKAEAEFRNKLLEQKSKIQDEHLTAYQNLRAVSNKIIYAMATASYEKYKGQLLLDADGKPIPIIPDAFQLEKAARALKIATEGERLAIGLPSNVSGLTDGKGDALIPGFAESVAEADKVLEENGITVSISRKAPPASDPS